MTKAYIPTNGSLKEIQAAILTVQQLGLDKQHTYIGGSFDTFAKNLNNGDTALVHSLDIFNSITQILAKTTEMQEKGITLNSIKEPWFNNPNITSKELLLKLFQLGAAIHTPVPNNARANKTSRTSILEKVRHAKQLADEHKMSIAKACKLSNCTISAYYTHVKKLNR